MLPILVCSFHVTASFLSIPCISHWSKNDELKVFLTEKATAESAELNKEELKQIAGGVKAEDVLVTVLAFGGCVTKSIYIVFNEGDCLGEIILS